MCHQNSFNALWKFRIFFCVAFACFSVSECLVSGYSDFPLKTCRSETKWTGWRSSLFELLISLTHVQSDYLTGVAVDYSHFSAELPDLFHLWALEPQCDLLGVSRRMVSVPKWFLFEHPHILHLYTIMRIVSHSTYTPFSLQAIPKVRL